MGGGSHLIEQTRIRPILKHPRQSVSSASHCSSRLAYQRFFPRSRPIKEPFGNLSGLKQSQIQSLQRLYRRRVPVAEFCTHELATRIVELSMEIRRQIGILLSRSGVVEYVIVGDERG